MEYNTNEKERLWEQDTLPGRVRRYMESRNMAPGGSRIVAGVSGGADSVCLLLVLYLLAEEMQWKIAAVHVNHGIRPEAGADAAYVRDLCARLGVPFYLKEEKVGALAQEWGCGEEEAGRRVRYQAFDEAAADFGASCIAVAHNRNDRAETLLFHLFRGTGLAGMASIRPVRGRIIRPLLDTGREEIEAWLQGKGFGWCIDNTNGTDTYTRNRIRRHILPLAVQEVCSGADIHLADEAELLMQTADYVERKAAEALKRCSMGGADAADAPARPAGIRIAADAFGREDAFLRPHILKLALNRISAGGRDLGRVHVEAVAALFEKQGSRRVMLPGGLEAVREFDTVVIRRKEERKKGALHPEESDVPCRKEAEFGTEDLKKLLDENGRCEVVVPGLGTAELSVERWEKSFTIPQKTYTKWMDYDRIKSLAIRARRPGDYLTVNDRLQKKSLKKYLIEEKVPADRRESLALLTDGDHILWVIGHRISSAVKITDATERVLRIYIRGGKENG